MLKHKTEIHKAPIIKFFSEHNPTIDQEYNDWIKSLPGVISLSNTLVDENKMERLIEFTDDAAYKNWLADRKAQPSWLARNQYEGRYGIIATSTRELIVFTENNDQIAIPK